tara:strand:+ start:271 stop:582 length:312 start_codon:yes stop_codon:yes gene_type:complete
MPSYYDKPVINNSEIYEHIFEPRGLEFLEQYRTKTFNNFKGKKFKAYRHIWVQGDTLRRISLKYHKTAKPWWIIGLVNGKPTDAHYKLGDTVVVPVNPNAIGV